MAKILVFLQQNAGQILKPALCALSAAQQLRAQHAGSSLVLVLLGPGAQTAAQSLDCEGVSQVLWSEHAELEKFRALCYAHALHQACQVCDAQSVVLAATSVGRDIAPCVAAMLEAGQASEILAINPDGSFIRPMYAGNVLAEVTVLTDKKVLSVRATAFPPAVLSVSGTASSGTASSGTVARSELALDFESVLARAGEYVSSELSSAERPELGDASVVVSGGRALGSAEAFAQYVFPLADALGAAVGASRAAVDSGYAPNDWQVGQTGKVVAPTLYIALGISGAIQHLAGMKDSKVIVAINKDPDAPIFEVADYGLVADLFQAAPQLTEAVKKSRGQ
jgi:electron transfer flavoprotein alpha subunit